VQRGPSRHSNYVSHTARATWLARRRARPRLPAPYLTVHGRRGRPLTTGPRPTPRVLLQGRGDTRQALGRCHAPRPHTLAARTAYRHWPPPATRRHRPCAHVVPCHDLLCSDLVTPSPTHTHLFKPAILPRASALQSRRPP
jgi:hypothetical protein